MIRTEDRPKCTEQWARAADFTLQLVSRSFCVPQDRLAAKSRSERHVAYARQAAMYLMHITFGGTYQDTGRALGRERTTVAYACSLIEDDRDDARFDRKLTELEECLKRLWYVERLRKVRQPNCRSANRAAA